MSHAWRSSWSCVLQFNCLEFPSPDSTPEHGVTAYMHDHTQGPACALACAAGTVVRNYFVPVTLPTVGGGAPVSVSGQSKENQLNTLQPVLAQLNRYSADKVPFLFISILFAFVYHTDQDSNIAVWCLGLILSTNAANTPTHAQIHTASHEVFLPFTTIIH